MKSTPRTTCIDNGAHNYNQSIRITEPKVIMVCAKCGDTFEISLQ